MTAEEFLVYIGETHVRCKGKQRHGLARERYLAYIQAYRVKTYLAAYYLHLDRANHEAIRKGLLDRDEGRAIVEVPELLMQE